MSGKREKQLSHQYENEWAAGMVKRWQEHVAHNPGVLPGVGMQRILAGNLEPIGMERPPVLPSQMQENHDGESGIHSDGSAA